MVEHAWEDVGALRPIWAAGDVVATVDVDTGAGAALREDGARGGRVAGPDGQRRR